MYDMLNVRVKYHFQLRLKRDDKIYRERTVRNRACCLDCNKINAQQRFIKETEEKNLFDYSDFWTRRSLDLLRYRYTLDCFVFRISTLERGIFRITRSIRFYGIALKIGTKGS